MKTATKPEISIVMTAFNSAAYIEEALDSVIAQKTSRTWELIFVDDGSTDETLSITSRYARRMPRTFFIHAHPGGENRGISASRNLALRHARGRLIAFLDSDDVWLPWNLETQTSMLDRVPNVSMIYGGAERWIDFSLPFDEAASRSSGWGRNYLPPLVPEGESAGLLRRGRLLQWFSQDESLVPCICAVMVRKDAALAVGGFCEDFRGLYDDQVFHAKLSRGYEIYAHDVCVARYRQHDKSCCAHARSNRQIEELERTRFDRFLLEPQLD